MFQLFDSDSLCRGCRTERYVVGAKLIEQVPRASGVIPAKAGIQEFQRFRMPVPDHVRDKLAPA
jgi:hypothetical protein